MVSFILKVIVLASVTVARLYAEGIDDFVILQTNSTLADSDVVFIGGTHGSSDDPATWNKHYPAAAWLINQYGHRKDLVLDEGDQFFRWAEIAFNQPSLQGSVASRIKVSGWDNREMIHITHQMSTKAERLYFSRDDDDHVLSDCYTMCFLKFALGERNKFLVRSVQDNLTHDRKLFVIVGSDHLRQADFRNYMKGSLVKYTILASKSSLGGRSDIESSSSLFDRVGSPRKELEEKVESIFGASKRDAYLRLRMPPLPELDQFPPLHLPGMSSGHCVNSARK